MHALRFRRTFSFVDYTLEGKRSVLEIVNLPRFGVELSEKMERGGKIASSNVSKRVIIPYNVIWSLV